MLLAWRLLRPEMWPAHIALAARPVQRSRRRPPGRPVDGLWTLTFLALDYVDSRVGWRDYWMDWLFAAAAILFYAAGSWYVARLMGSETRFAVMLPQLGLSIFAYPLVARLVLALDRWRLSR